MREARNDSRKEAEFRIKNYELLGQDSTGVDYGLHGIGIALGSTATDPENAWPNLVTYALDDLDKLNTLDLSKVERKNDSFLNRLYEAEQIILEKIGGEVGGVDFSLCGPVTAAASIYPTSLLLRAIRKTPEKVHELLRFSIEAAQSWGASRTQIVFKVMLKESIPSIISGLCLAVINLLGCTAMAGAVGAGGLGAVALTYGYQNFNETIMYSIVVILVVMVAAIQYFGDWIYRKMK